MNPSMPNRIPSVLPMRLLRQARLDDAAEAGVDHAGGSAALTDDCIAVKHRKTPSGDGVLAFRLGLVSFRCHGRLGCCPADDKPTF